MTEQYLIFTDLDGTLLDHYDYSFSPAVPMLKTLAEQGIPVIPTTSKTFAEVVALRQEADLHAPFIIENGAAVVIPHHCFSAKPDGCEEYKGYWLKSFSPTRQHWLNVLQQTASDFKQAYLGFSQMSLAQLSDATSLPLASAQAANLRMFSEPLQWLGTEQQKQAFKSLLEQAGAHVLQGGRFVHISGHCNKGKAMQWLQQLYTTSTQQTISIALGDSYNDVDMLEMADIAVQIKSVKHDFPALERNQALWQSKVPGPKGWAQCLADILQLE